MMFFLSFIGVLSLGLFVTFILKRMSTKTRRDIILGLLLGLTIGCVIIGIYSPLKTYLKFYGGNDLNIIADSAFHDKDKENIVELHKKILALTKKKNEINEKEYHQNQFKEPNDDERIKLEKEIEEINQEIQVAEAERVRIQDLGPISDWFNIVTPFMALASFLLLLLTYVVQRWELTEADRRASRQQFDSTFFNLLNLHRDIVKDMAFSENGREFLGRKYFKKAYEDFATEYMKKYNIWIDENSAFADIEEAYKNFYNIHQDNLAHYFRNTYNILKMIHQMDIPMEDKNSYVRFLRSQLSTYELLLLFYNAMVGHGFNKFKLLIYKYDLLQHLRKNLLVSEQNGMENITCWSIYHHDIRLANVNDDAVLSDFLNIIDDEDEI